jgi:hypothetical protein
MSGMVKNRVKMYLAKVYVNFRLQLYKSILSANNEIICSSSSIEMPLTLLLDLIASASDSMTNVNKAGDEGQP